MLQPILGICWSGPLLVLATIFIATFKSLSPLLIGFKSFNSLNLPLYWSSRSLLYPKKSGVQTASYLFDETQEIAKKYEAVCTPDFFGYNKNLELQYRGRFRELKDLKPVNNGESDLKVAMKMIAKTNKGPNHQIPSMGCNIKWFN